jgi:hypothetical protein
MNTDRVGRALGGLVILLACGVTSYINCDPAKLRAHPSLNAENRDVYYRSFAIRGYLASYEAWRWIDSNVNEDAVILQVWDEASMYFRTRKTLNPSTHGSIPLARFIDYSSKGKFLGFKNGVLLLGTLKGLGATHLLVNSRRVARTRPKDTFFIEQTEEVYSKGGIVLYKLPSSN